MSRPPIWLDRQPKAKGLRERHTIFSRTGLNRSFGTKGRCTSTRVKMIFCWLCFPEFLHGFALFVEEKIARMALVTLASIPSID